GFGCLRLLESVARAYTGEEEPPPATDLSRARDVRGILETDDTRARAERFRALADKVRDVVDAPCRVAAVRGEDRAGYGFVHRSLSAADTAALSVPDGPTVNDVLMAALHRAVDGWNAEHGAGCRRVSVLMPVNLRPREWRQDVVTNMVLMTRVSSSRADRRSDGALLEAVCAQTQRIKRWGTGAALIEVLRGMPRLPLWAKQSLSPLLTLTGNRLVDTAILTNLGELDEAPAFGEDAGRPRALWFSAPGRMPCGLSLGAVTVNGELDLSFRYRYPLLDGRAADRFADRYLDGLGRLAKEQAAGAR
ncbi:MAG TPA: hypothetical protein VFO65_09835, partial [Acidimicrobiales bacterium]|nr:hypothetical protein [Acidimicrobiales bacterium]